MPGPRSPTGSILSINRAMNNAICQRLTGSAGEKVEVEVPLVISKLANWLMAVWDSPLKWPMSVNPKSVAEGTAIPTLPARRIRNNAMCSRITASSGE